MNMRSRSFIPFLAVGVQFVILPTPHPALAQVARITAASIFGGTNGVFAYGVAVDAAGNCFVTGYFRGTADFGTTKLTSAGMEDMFLSKCTWPGQELWTRQAGGSGDDLGSAVAVDGSGNSYVAGSFQTNASFGAINLESLGGYNAFFAKYGPTGNLVWARQAGGSSGGTDGYGIAVDASGNSYVTGGYLGPAQFGAVTLPNVGPLPRSDEFLAKYDPVGNVSWADFNGGPDDDWGALVALSSNGNVYSVSAWGSGASPYLVLSKHSTNGTGGTYFSIQGSGSVYPAGVAVDSVGNSWVSGLFSGSVSLAGTNLNGTGRLNTFLAKLDPNGNPLWARKLGGTNDFGNGLVVDQLGNSYVASSFSGAAVFGGNVLTSIGMEDGFVAKYDSSGNFIWVLRIGGTGLVRPSAITLTGDGGLYFVGGFTGEALFGAARLAVGGSGWNAFLARIDELPTLCITHLPNQVLLSWPTNQPSFSLQKSGDLSLATGWNVMTNVPAIDGDHNVVSDRVLDQPSYYRLRKR